MEKPKLEDLSELNREMKKLLDERQTTRKELEDIFSDVGRRSPHRQAKLVED